ncbi:hypothetical protein [Streptomyces mangrovisoli]|uniref:Uncharacterized protein n=1 Tax=Streptomyces mangrovisoli TaxID=1428628 RepID=A0A1J4NY50_9ACTN|nr:hypothetical protein [Streptomyces mangrovisoli]OIJ67457.1 hypothetical protein WN71_012770 [Streptomyces mangrovisoli]
MPVSSDAEPDLVDLPVIRLDAARELFRTSESSGLGRPGTDEVFDEWLRVHEGIAFYRNADRPVQARPIVSGDEIPEWLDNSRIGRARLEAVCVTSWWPASAQAVERPEGFVDADEDDDGRYDEANDTETCT